LSGKIQVFVILTQIKFDLFRSKEYNIFSVPLSGIIDSDGTDMNEVVLDRKANHFPDGESEALLYLFRFLIAF
jgi:hypothetical protein